MIALGVEELLAFGGRLPIAAENRRARWARRDGLVLELRDPTTGTVGQGEASPLPDFSREDLSEVRRALEGLAGARLVLDEEAPFSGWLAATAAVRQALPASGRCALEASLLDLFARRGGVPAWAPLGLDAQAPPAPRALAQLLFARDVAAVAAEARAAQTRGAGAMKLKVGRPGCFTAELALAAAARAAAPELPLRLDANRAWSGRELFEALDRIAELDCEFVEEPAAGLDLGRAVAGEPAALDLVRALAKAPVSIALDESLRDAPAGAARALAAPGFPAALVLKPMILGGLERCLGLAREAAAVGAAVIVTHAFEGPLGLATAAAVALAVGTAGRAMGLAPHPGLAAWPDRSLAALRDDQLVPWQAPGLGVERLTRAEGAP